MADDWQREAAGTDVSDSTGRPVFVVCAWGDRPAGLRPGLPGDVGCRLA